MKTKDTDKILQRNKKHSGSFCFLFKVQSCEQMIEWKNNKKFDLNNNFFHFKIF